VDQVAVCSEAPSCVPSVLEFDLRAFYLFTRSDLKTIVRLSSSSCLLSLVRPFCLSQPPMQAQIICYIPPYCIRTWLHLLQLTVSNQSLNPDDDASNIPWRPVPSGLISTGCARTLRWILLLSCFSSPFVWGHRARHLPRVSFRSSQRITPPLTLANAQRLRRVGLCVPQLGCICNKSWYVLLWHGLRFHVRPNCT